MQGTGAFPSMPGFGQPNRAETNRMGRRGVQVRARQRTMSGVLVYSLLLLTMLVGGYFRFVGLNWDDFTHLHPDERFLTGVAQSLNRRFAMSENDLARREEMMTQCISRYPDTGGMAPMPQGYFDTYCSAMNPHNTDNGDFVYGTLPLFMARGVGEVVAVLSETWTHNVMTRLTGDETWANYEGNQWTTYDGVHLVWRSLSALAEMGVIVIAFYIGKRLHGNAVGLLAAFLYAVSVFSIQMAHFGTADAISNFFAALTILGAVMVQKRGSLWDYLGAGFAFGMAVASRINLLFLIGLIGLGFLVQVLPAFERRLFPGERQRIFTRHLGGLVASFVVAFLAFRVFNPYAFVGPGFFGLMPNRAFLDDLTLAQILISGVSDSPPNFQWVSRAAYLFPLNNIVVWGLGIPLGITAIASFLAALWRIIRGRPGALANVLLVAWVAVYFGYMGRQWVTTMRYFLPIYVALAVLAAWGLVTFYSWARNRVEERGKLRRVGTGLARGTSALLLAGVPLFSLVWAGMFTNIYRHQLTRVQAANWVFENVPGDFAMRVVPTNAPDLPTATIDANAELNGEADTYTADFTAPAAGALYELTANGLQVSTGDGGAGIVQITVERGGDNIGGEAAAQGQEVVLATLRYNGVLPGIAQEAAAGEVVVPDEATAGIEGEATPETEAATELPEDPAPQSPQSLTFTLDPITTVQAGEPLRLRVQALNGATATLGTFSFPMQPQNQSDYAAVPVPLISIPVANNWSGGGTPDDLLSRVTRYDTSLTADSFDYFIAPETGVITTIRAPHLGDPNDDPEAEVLDIRIADENGNTLATARVDQNLTRTTHITGDPVDVALDRPLNVTAGGRYNFSVSLVSGGPVVSGGAIFTWEGAWDDPIPTKVCTLPAGISLYDDPPPGLIMDGRECNGRDPWWGLVTGYEQNIVYEDDYSKVESLIRSLNNSDYIGISSNRFYDTLSRNPLRWPLSVQYYRWLFGGELGFELVGTFQETYELGPLRVSDQYLPMYDPANAWLNEFESEEAFSVYDHPVVFIFRQRHDYDPARVESLIRSVPITQVEEASPFMACPEDGSLLYCNPTLVSRVQSLPSERADRVPTQLQFTPDQRIAQYSGGTWRDRFDVSSIINSNPAVTIGVWWLSIIVFGWAAFPLLFAAFPGLADRGYAMAKFAGIFLTAWATWFLASARIEAWNQVGIAAALVALLLIGVLLARRRGNEFGVWLRANWRKLLVIEVITGLLFAAFLAIRLTNPDLWVQGFGGEKPMDFAYFNGVLRSTIFPPVDPWNAGGFTNYYYFGFVIVGAPTLLLGVVPSIAYNLILPTLFACLGIAAYSLAFTLVWVWRERANNDPTTRARTLGSPFLAGIAALLLAVVLGNLDTPRVALGAIANLGGYQQPQGLYEFLQNEYEAANNGVLPDEAALGPIMTRAAENNFFDRVRYELSNVGQVLGSLGRGFVAVANGQQPYLGADRWFWGPTRIYAEPPVSSGGAIVEMPAFTFIYGDMHAHMIAMPLQLLAVAFVLNEVLLAGSDARQKGERTRGGRTAALSVGAIAVGMLRATNTWDWITFMILGVAGLSFAVWLTIRANQLPLFSRRSLMLFVGQVGGFLALSFIAVAPYTAWFVTTYNSVRPWTDAKTPIWAFLDVHGLFLFLIVSFLVWDTARWLRSVYVKSLRGNVAVVLTLALIVGTLLVASLVLALLQWQVTLIVLPLLIWVAALFFRAGQTRPMQVILAFVGLALGLTLGVEYIVLDGDVGRQNTVFKFYIQVWLLFSIAGGVAFSLLWQSSQRWRASLRVPWLVALTVLVAIASLFPIMASQAKAIFRMDRTQPFTLDGMDFMLYGRVAEGDPQVMAADPTLSPFPLTEDHAMIRWLQDNVQGTPTIIEGLADDTQYRWNGRISIYTGLPAVLGWNFHQRQQRTPDPLGRMVEFRNANVNAFYETSSMAAAWNILRFYDVSYVIVGRYERAHTNALGLSKFDQMRDLGLLEPVFTEGQSVIYRVARERFYDPVLMAQMDANALVQG